MQSSRDNSLLNELVANSKKLASTEDILLFVAARGEMLDLSKRLTSNGDSELLHSFKNFCNDENINSKFLLNNLKEVVRSLSAGENNILDAYNILGLDSSATEKEVKKAYRRLSMQFHPDHSSKQGTEAMFQKIQEAYHSILDEKSGDNLHASPWVNNGISSPPANNKQKVRIFWGASCLFVILVFFSVFLAHKNETRTLQNRSSVASKTVLHQTPSPPLTPNPIKTSQSSPAVTEFPDPEEDIDDKILEMETIIPPDPELVASLEHPFPFRTNSLHSNAAKKTVTRNHVNTKTKTTVQKKEQKQISEKEKELEAKIIALEKKINQLENQPAFSHTAPPQTDRSLTEKKPELIETTSEMGKLPPTSPKPPVATEKYNQTAQIQQFLDGFIETYTKRNLPEHMAHFAENATENETPVKSLYPSYKKLFAATSKIEMKIHNYKWHYSERDVSLSGAFTANYTYLSGKNKFYSGAVTFLLHRNNSDKLLIDKLAYSISN